MTKKHFEALAAELMHRAPEGKQARFGWIVAVCAVSDVCARFNPNFDRARFLAACGVEEAK